MTNFEYNTSHNYDPSQPSLFPDSDPMNDLQAPCLRYEIGEVMMNDHKFIGLFCNDDLVEVHIENRLSDGTINSILKWTENYQLSDVVN